jgi:hypothetical protein
MRRTSGRSARGSAGIVGVVVLALASLAVPAAAATAPVDLSGLPVDGNGPGVAVTPSSGVVQGASVTIDAENLPSAAEVAAWSDVPDGAVKDDDAPPLDANSPFKDEVGTYDADVVLSLCGNATSAGTVFPEGSFDPAQHCDGGADGTHPTASHTALVDVELGSLTGVTFATRNGTLAGIGPAGAQCLPVLAFGDAPCRVRIQNSSAAPGDVFVAYVTFTVKPAPTLTFAGVDGQLPGALAARAGNSVVVTGTGWDPALAGSLTAAFCDVADPSICDGSSSVAGLSVDGAGVLSGAVPVDVDTTTGNRVLKVTQGDGQAGTVSIRILGDRAILLNPSSGGANTTVDVLGTDFDPLQAVTLHGWDGVANTTDTATVVTDATGSFGAQIFVTKTATVAIVAREDDDPNQGASAPFSFNQQVQTGELTINGSALTLEQASGTFTLDPITLNGQAQVSTGSIADLTITDGRGTLVGWSLSATITDFVDTAVPQGTTPPVSHVIPAGNVSWTPTCGPALGSGGDPAEVSDGGPATFGPGVSHTLCAAAPGGGGGVWAADATISVAVPASIAAGQYEATLTLLLT